MKRKDPLEDLRAVARPAAPRTIDPELDQYRARQRSRARVMALALGAFVVLMFFISIAKMTIVQ